MAVRSLCESGRTKAAAKVTQQLCALTSLTLLEAAEESSASDSWAMARWPKSVFCVVCTQIIFHSMAAEFMEPPHMHERWAALFQSMVTTWTALGRELWGYVAIKSTRGYGSTSVLRIAMATAGHTYIRVLLDAGWRFMCHHEAAKTLKAWSSYVQLHYDDPDEPAARENADLIATKIVEWFPDCIATPLHPLCHLSSAACNVGTTSGAACKMYSVMTRIIARARLSEDQARAVGGIHGGNANYHAHTLLGRVVTGTVGKPPVVAKAAVKAVSAVASLGVHLPPQVYMLKGCGAVPGIAEAFAAIIASFKRNHPGAMVVAYTFWNSNAEGRTCHELCVTIRACIDLFDGGCPFDVFHPGRSMLDALLEHQRLTTCPAVATLLALVINREAGWRALESDVPSLSRNERWARVMTAIAEEDTTVAALVFKRLVSSEASADTHHGWTPTLHGIAARRRAVSSSVKCRVWTVLLSLSCTGNAVVTRQSARRRRVTIALPRELIARILTEAFRNSQIDVQPALCI